MSVSVQELEYLQQFRATGDQHAFERLYDAYRNRLYSLALHTIGDPYAAQDVVQEAFIEAYRALPTLRDDKAFASWIYRIVIFRCNRIFRKRREQLMGEPAEHIFAQLEDSSPMNDPQYAAADNERVSVMRGYINRLPTPQKICVLMYYYHDLSVGEIAQSLNCSEGTIKSRLNYARNALRKMLGDADGNPMGVRLMAAVPFVAMPAAAASGIWKSVAATVSTEKTAGLFYSLRMKLYSSRYGGDTMFGVEELAGAMPSATTGATAAVAGTAGAAGAAAGGAAVAGGAALAGGAVAAGGGITTVIAAVTVCATMAVSAVATDGFGMFSPEKRANAAEGKTAATVSATAAPTEPQRRSGYGGSRMKSSDSKYVGGVSTETDIEQLLSNKSSPIDYGMGGYGDSTQTETPSFIE